MQLTNYQKVILTWGIGTFIGYIITSQSLTNLTIAWIAWILISLLGFFMQYKLTWGGGKVRLIHYVWIILITLGTLLTILGVNGTIKTDINVNAFWLVLTSFGYAFSGILMKNYRFHFLALLYLIAGFIFQNQVIKNDLIITGFIFLLFTIVDALLEYLFIKAPSPNNSQQIQTPEIK